jgi:hypothetical protein
VEKAEDVQRIISFLPKAVALGTAVISIVLGYPPEATDIRTPRAGSATDELEGHRKLGGGL